jgi:hypothetical protein
MADHLQWLRNTSAIQCGHSKLGIETKTILQTSKLPKAIKFNNCFDTPFHAWFHFSLSLFAGSFFFPFGSLR